MTVADARGRLDQPARHVDRLVRACTPAPGAWTTFRGERLKLGPVRDCAVPTSSRPGELRVDAGRGAGRHRHVDGRARHRAAARQAADAGRRTGRAARGSTPASVLAERRRAPRRRNPSRHRPRVRPRPGAIRPDPAWWPTSCCARSRPTTPTPTWCCRGCSPTPAWPAATPRWPPSWATARCAPPAPSTRSWPRCVDRPLAEVEPRCCDLLRLGAYQLLRTRIPPHAAVATHGRSGPRDRQRPGRRLRQRGAAQGGRARLGRLDRAARRGTHRRCGTLALRTAHPEWIARGLRRRARRATLAETDGRAGRRRRRARRPTWSPGPGAVDRDELLAEAGGGAPARTRRTRCAWPAAIRRGLAAVRERRAGVQDEGSQLCALALADRAARRAATSAGWTCAPAGWQGGAARRAGRRRGATLTANELHPHRAELVAERHGAVARSRSASATPAR